MCGPLSKRAGKCCVCVCLGVKHGVEKVVCCRAYEYDMHEKWNSKSFYRFTDAIGIQHSLRNILLIATYILSISTSFLCSLFARVCVCVCVSCCCVFWQIRFDHLIMHRNVYRIFAEEMNAFCVELKQAQKCSTQNDDENVSTNVKKSTHLFATSMIYPHILRARIHTHIHMA